MQRIAVLGLFILATLSWAPAQQPGNMPQGSSGQATSPRAQSPDTTPSQPSRPGATGQNVPQTGTQDGSQGANVAITEGCLGGTNPNYTITDATGTTYKLNVPPGADVSSLQAHIGEPVAVMGTVTQRTSANQSSIDVNKIGRGHGPCPTADNSTGTPPPQKQ